ncbi:hypothetical protein WJX74_001403 [Apatococcus lobatus]|uniref:t-SNARE coiled-coil homology domain-containing protein n=1 Tax=Apatococcus lobatus TaxID=904363 RepID=A0AAW1QWR7_9CHLO
MSSGTVGATRNRTDLFLKYRSQARGTSKLLRPGGSSPSIPADRGASRLLDAAIASTLENGASDLDAAALLPPKYVDFKEQIRTEMFSIKQKMNELRQMHGKASLTSFDDSGSSDVEIEVLTQEITRLFRKCELRLQQFGQTSSATEADSKVMLNVQRTLAIELQKLSVQFRKQQKTYLTRLRKAEGGGPSGLSVLDGTGERPADEEYDPGFSEIQVMKVDTLDAFAQERDREVRSILQSINDLAQIMKDLSTLVIDQGTVLDRIDYNMEQVAMKVDEGVKQLVRAEQHQKNSRLIICIMFLIVAVILMLIILIAKSVLF